MPNPAPSSRSATAGVTMRSCPLRVDGTKSMRRRLGSPSDVLSSSTRASAFCRLFIVGENTTPTQRRFPRSAFVNRLATTFRGLHSSSCFTLDDHSLKTVRIHELVWARPLQKAMEQPTTLLFRQTSKRTPRSLASCAFSFILAPSLMLPCWGLWGCCCTFWRVEATRR